MGKLRAIEYVQAEPARTRSNSEGYDLVIRYPFHEFQNSRMRHHSAMCVRMWPSPYYDGVLTLQDQNSVSPECPSVWHATTLHRLVND